MATSRLSKSLQAPEHPRQFVVLCLGFACFGASFGLFAAGNVVLGVVLLLLALVFFFALGQTAPQRGNRLSEHSVTAAEVWRTRLQTSLSSWRTRSRLDEVELARGPALRDLGAAVRSGDRRAANDASRRLDELEEQERSLAADLQLQAAQAEERIRLARLPVEETVMIAPNEPSAPYPPPDEGDPPTPAIVPEPTPPPDEGTPPTPAPAPDPGDYLRLRIRKSGSSR